MNLVETGCLPKMFICNVYEKCINNIQHYKKRLLK